MSEALVQTMRGIITNGADAKPMAEFHSPTNGLLFTIIWDFPEFGHGVVVHQIARLGRCFGANRAIFIADSFMRTLDVDEPVPQVLSEGELPRNDPRSTEAVVLVETTGHEVLRHVHYPYHRNDDGTIRWDPEERVPVTGGDVVDGLQHGLRSTLPLLFATDARGVMAELMEMTTGPVLVAPAHQYVVDHLGPGNHSAN